MSTDLQERRVNDVLDESYASLFSELSGTFRARGLTAEEARDLAQESLVRTFVHLKRHGQTRPDLRPLAHTIAKRLYVERGRCMRPQFVDLPQAEEVVDPAPQPADVIVAMEERRDVQAALRALGPRHRRVISLWMGGLRPAEIARELGIKRNAADALLHRARRQLASKLDPGRGALGLIGLVVLRLRTGVRRVVDAVAGLDPSGSAAQAGAGLAVAGLAAVLLAMSPNGTELPKSEAGPIAVEVDAATNPDPVAPVTEKASVGAQNVISEKVQKVVHQKVSAGRVRNPYNGKDEDLITIEHWYYPEDASPLGGALDPVVEQVVNVSCGRTAGSCGGKGG